MQVFANLGMGVLVYDAPTDWNLDAQIADADERDRLEWLNFRERGSTWSALQSAIEILVRRGEVDRSAIGITGLSDAAETAAWALAQGARFRAAIFSTPTWDPIHYDLLGSKNLAADLPAYGLGPLTSGKVDSWKMMSVALNCERITTPILANLSDREMLRFLQTKANCEYHARPIEVYVYPDEYHLKWQPSHRMAIYNRNVDWMSFWLRDTERSPNSVQYGRWTQLREERDRAVAAQSVADQAR